MPGVSETSLNAFRSNKSTPWLVAAALVVVSVATYFKAFTGFSWWDDEGYLMITVHDLLRGKTLYNQVYTLYGPCYYLFHWILYGTTGLKLTHESVRFTATALWLVSSGLLAASAFAITRSLLISGMALLIAARLLRFFAWEPGHPEEVCLVLLASLLLVCCRLSGPPRARGLIAMGVLIGALAQAKINLGLYAGFAVLLSLSVLLIRTRTFLLLAGLGSVGIVLIMRPLLNLPWAAHYCSFVVLSLLAAALICIPCIQSRTREIGGLVQSCVWLGASAAFAWLAIVVPFLIQGTTWKAFLYITVLQHKNFTNHWFRQSDYRLRSVAWSLLSLAVAASWVRWKPRHLVPFLKILFAGFGLIHLIGAPVEPDQIGLHTSIVLAPFSWLVLIDPDGRRDLRFARAAVCFVSILTTLYAFPVSGSQSIFAVLPLILAIALCLRDTVTSYAPHVPHRLQKPAAAFACFLLFVAYAADLAQAERLYSNLVPFGLPGTNHIHVERSDAELYRSIVAQVGRRCPSFFTMPGLYSLYFWTGQESPTTLTMNDWPVFFGPGQQQAMLDELKARDTGCVIYNPESVERLSAGRDAYAGPLAKYARSDFALAQERVIPWQGSGIQAPPGHLEPFLTAYGHYGLLLKRSAPRKSFVW